LRAVRPDASKTICLQFYPDLQGIRVNLVHSSLRFLYYSNVASAKVVP
jgi:hypothetical protein